ncbi:MAG: FG-GAP repeat domain-containing protein, partial [Kiritimatiellia bacterium]
GAETYEVWRATDGAPELIGISGSTNYLDRAVEVGVEYFYRLRGVNPIGTSEWSEGAWGWCRAARDDFTGNGFSDLWYYHAPNGTWYVIVGEGETARAQLGGPDTRPVPADYDGDGRADPMVYEPLTGYWAALLSGSGYQQVEVSGWGGPGSVPAPGDFDGDGLTDPAVYYEDTGLWRVWLSGSGYAEVAAYLGGPGRQAVPGDFDGDGLADPAVYSAADGKWYIWESGSGYALREIADWSLGGRSVIPVAGDYLGIGHDVPGLYYRESGLWYFRRADGTTRMEEFGHDAATPLIGDYDGDGVTDLGLIYRERFETIWQLLMSEEGYREVSGSFGRPRP